MQVVLIFSLGLPEGAGLAHFRDELARKKARGVDDGNGLLGDLALLVARKEDLRPVVGADDAFAEVVSMTVQEELEKLSVGDSLGVEDHLDRLGVPGVVLISRVVVLPAGVSHAGRDDP